MRDSNAVAPPPDESARNAALRAGFTLIELSILLVIIGLVVGGVLVGQDLIRAAQVRATITQIEKYNQAVNTFYGKYGALPGDMSAPLAAQFGFTSRNGCQGAGDGNGAIEGLQCSACGVSCAGGANEEGGETLLFWVDLSDATLIDASFTAAKCCANVVHNSALTLTTSPGIKDIIPSAKLGQGSFIGVWSGGGAGPGWGNSLNYYTLSTVTGVGPGLSQAFSGGPSLSVQQAYNIDKKMDDGLPQSGNVTAKYDNQNFTWAASGADGTNSGAHYYGPSTAATAGSSTTCYDNGNVAGVTQQYSLGQNGGSGVNCALSFQFQ